MSNSGGVISAPVDVRGDIAAVLGVQSGDLGVLCTNAAVNMWAKYKPYRDSSPAVLSAARIAAKYGLYLPTLTLSEMQAAVRTWGKLQPRGAAYSEPFRALDFAGYNHNATQPSFVFTLPWISNNRGANAFLGNFVEGSNLEFGDLVSNTLASGIDTNYPAPPYPLDEFYLMFVIFAGSTIHVYNTGQHISVGGTAAFPDQAFSDVATGATCLAIACLALTDYLPIGDTKLDITGPDSGFYTNTLFIPLNVSGTVGEKSLTMTHWEPFVNFDIASVSLQYPSTGYISWKVTELVVSCDSINATGTSFLFYVKLYVYRNGQLVPGGNPYPSYSETVTMNYVSMMNRYYGQFTYPFLGDWPAFVPATDTAIMTIEYDGGVLVSKDVTNYITGPRTS